jgi:hypothetical protein
MHGYRVDGACAALLVIGFAMMTPAMAASGTTCLCRTDDNTGFVETTMRHSRWACDYKLGYIRKQAEPAEEDGKASAPARRHGQRAQAPLDPNLQHGRDRPIQGLGLHRARLHLPVRPARGDPQQSLENHRTDGRPPPPVTWRGTARRNRWTSALSGRANWKITQINGLTVCFGAGEGLHTHVHHHLRLYFEPHDFNGLTWKLSIRVFHCTPVTCTNARDNAGERECGADRAGARGTPTLPCTASAPRSGCGAATPGRPRAKSPKPALPTPSAAPSSRLTTAAPCLSAAAP